MEHHEVDLRSARAREVLSSGVSALVHLGVVHDPRADSAEDHAVNVTGVQKLFEYVEHFGIKKVVVLSSANVYGPRPDNPQFLTEDAPLLGAGPFSQIRDLVELDMGAQSFFWRLPDVATVILRPAHILGTVRNAPSNYLRLPVIPTLLGFDPMMQAVHQDDVVRAIMLALAPSARGIYNIAGPAPVPLSRVIELLERSTRRSRAAHGRPARRRAALSLARHVVPGARARLHPLHLHDRRRSRAPRPQLRSRARAGLNLVRRGRRTMARLTNAWAAPLPALLGLAVTGCPAAPKEGPPPAESFEIAAAAPQALGALAAGTEGAPKGLKAAPPAPDEAPVAPNDDEGDAGAAPDAALETPEDVPL